MYTCPQCGHSGDPKDFQKAASGPVAKAAQIHKASALTYEHIVKSVRAANPMMSEAEARNAALNTPEFSALHRAERDARFENSGFA